MISSKKILVFYHKNCADGFSGAWVARQQFRNRAEYIPIAHYDKPIFPKNKKVYFIDIVYEPKDLKKLLKSNEVTIIDHHVSTRETVKLAPEYLYELNHSGAVLAWKYFNGKKSAPKLLQYVETIDLWRFSLPHSRIIGSYLRAEDLNFKNWDRLVECFDDSKKFKRVVEEGKTIQKYTEKIIEDIISEGAELVNFQGQKVFVVNSPIFNSEIANRLATLRPPFGVVWVKKNGLYKVSLRSVGSFDVSKLAAKFSGGGGHKNAAGFSTKKLPW